MSGRQGARGRRVASLGLPARHAGRFGLPGLRRLPRRVTVRGPSMMPTLSEGDVVLALPGARVRDGAVALVRWAERPGQLSVKRVRAPSADGRGDARGDNPRASTDSRELGPAQVLAVVAWRLWPRPGRLPAVPDPPGVAAGGAPGR